MKSLLILSLLAILCAIMIHTSASAQQTPAAATPITQQPAKIQQFVRNVNSTLAATPTKKQSKVRFLRQILKDLKELGLLKNASEEAPYNKKDAQITLEKISTIVKHLLQLKKDGKTDDLKNYIDDLNKSKNFEEAVRLVRRILRRFLRRKVRKLAKKIKQIAKQGQTVVATAVAANTTAPAKPKRRVNRRFPIEKFLAKLEKSLLKVKRAGGVSGLWRKTRRAATRRFPRRFPRDFALRRFPQRRSSRRSAPRRSAPRRRAPRRRSQRRAPRRRGSKRQSRRGPRRAPRRRSSRRAPRRRSQRRFPRRRAAPRRSSRRVRRFPRRRAVRRFPRRFPRRVARRFPRRRANRKPFLVVNRQLLKHVVGSYLRRKQQKPTRA